MDINFKIKLEEYIKNLNIFNYGYTSCREFKEIESYLIDKKKLGYNTEFEESDISKRINPFLYLENGKTIISFAFPYLLTKQNINLSFSKYTTTLDYHYIVNGYLNSICRFLENYGYNAKALVDSNNLPERYISYLCGIGHIGRNSLLYTKDYGSYVFLGEIITDAILCENYEHSYYEKKFQELNEFQECKECKACINNCPNNILINKNFSKCVSALTQKKHLEDLEIDMLNGMIFGCDVCQDICPKNKNIKLSEDKLFNQEYFLNSLLDEDILNMNNSFFKENFKKLSCSWRGKSILKRNAMIKFKSDKNYIEKLNFEDIEYLKYYKNKILDK